MSVVGIDPSVDHPALAIWPFRETWQLKIEGQGSARLDALFCQIRGWCAAHAPNDLEAVFIERPTGQFPSPALVQANGVIQVAMVRGATALFSHPLSVFEISPGTWKKEALGSGRAKKQDVLEWSEVELSKNPRRYPRISQDEADALAIACAGYRYLTRGS